MALTYAVQNDAAHTPINPAIAAEQLKAAGEVLQGQVAEGEAAEGKNAKVIADALDLIRR